MTAIKHNHRLLTLQDFSELPTTPSSGLEVSSIGMVGPLPLLRLSNQAVIYSVVKAYLPFVLALYRATRIEDMNSFP